MKSSSRHVFHLNDAEPHFSSEDGVIRRVTVKELPILKNLSMKRLTLHVGAIREPHWHANCAELTYCIEGECLVSVLDNENKFGTFTISAGQLFHIPSGSLHHIENVGSTTAELLVTFRHELPEDFALSASFGAMSDAVLGNTYDAPSAAFHKIKRDTKPKFIVKRPSGSKVEIPTSARLHDPHKFDVEGQLPPTAADGIGWAKKARKQFWPMLNDISMYSLMVEEQGMREPHWHPDTAEMGYVHKGEARMSILDPDGSVDTYLLKPGDCYFIPAAYPHQIECLSKEEIHFMIFFDQPMPLDIGYRTSATAFSREVLAATFGLEEGELPDFPMTAADPLLVARINEKDPVENGTK